MSRPPLPAHIVEFLHAANPCVIASNRPDGQPVSVATWYLLQDDGRILVNIDRISTHYTGNAYPTRDRERVNGWIDIESWHGWHVKERT